MTSETCNVASHTDMLIVDIQTALSDTDGDDADEPPSGDQLTTWARSAFAAAVAPSAVSLTAESGSLADAPERAREVTIRLVGCDEITQLNYAYRGKNKTTNVLSFPFEMDIEIPLSIDEEPEPMLLGDVVICHPVIVQEAAQQDKTTQHHYAHMVTHGILHLCGFDHEDDLSANEMESLETRILAKNNIANPYS